MDERQILIRGKIFRTTCFAAIIYMGIASCLNEFGVIDINGEIGISDFLMSSAIFMTCYMSLMTIWKDAYFGPKNTASMKRFTVLITSIAIIFDGLVIFHLIRGKYPDLMIISGLIMVNLISVSIIYKQIEYKKQ